MISRIFYIGIDGLEVYVGNRHGFARQMHFTHVDNGVQRFADYLVANAGTHSAVIVDVIEEEYRHEQIPRVSARERKGLLRRKMAQYFRGTTLCLATVTGKHVGARIEEKVVMSALTNNLLLDPWLDQMQQMKVPVAAIYSAPYMVARLVGKIALRHEFAILVTYHEGVGLRQTLVHDGHVLFSRLCPGALADTGEYRQAVLRELDKTERYINKLKLVPAGQETHVHVLMCEQFQTATLTEVNSGPGTRHIHYIAPVAVRAAGHRKLAGDQAQLKNLLCLCAAQGKRAANYADEHKLFYFRQYRIKAGVRAASVAAGVVFLTFFAAGTVQSYVSKSAIARMTLQTQEWELEYDSIVKNTLTTEVPAQVIKESVVQAENLAAHRLRLTLLLGGISAELRQYRNIEIAAIEWVKGAQMLQARDVNAGEEYFLNIYPMPGLDQNDQVVLLRGRVISDSTGYTDIFHMLMTLKARLEKVPTIREVRLVRLPIDKESTGQIDGRFNAWHPELQAEFVLRAVYHDG